MEEKKNWLKDNRSPDVLEALLPFLEAESIPDEKAPVRACHRYISNRTDFLDYKGALAAGLSIGSGEIESAHRYVIQVRVKIAGAIIFVGMAHFHFFISNLLSIGSCSILNFLISHRFIFRNSDQAKIKDSVSV